MGDTTMVRSSCRADNPLSVRNTPLHLFCLTVPASFAESAIHSALDTFLKLGSDFAALNSKDSQSATIYALRNPSSAPRESAARWLAAHSKYTHPRGSFFGSAAAGESFVAFWKANNIPDSLFKFAFAGGFLPSDEDKKIIINSFPEAFDYIRVLDVLADLHIPLEHFKTLAAEEINFESLVRMGPSEVSKLAVPKDVQQKLLSAIEKEQRDDDDDVVKLSRNDSAQRSARLNVGTLEQPS